MAIISLVFLGVYAYVVIGNLRPSDTDWPEALMNAIRVLFALHYVISLILVPHTGRWFLTYLHELAIVEKVREAAQEHESAVVHEQATSQAEG